MTKGDFYQLVYWYAILCEAVNVFVDGNYQEIFLLNHKTCVRDFGGPHLLIYPV